VTAAVAEVVSLPVTGPNILFPFGLAIGVCAAIVSLHIIGASIEGAVKRGKKAPVILGFVVRILLYGGTFWFGLKTSYVSGVGVAIGFLLPHLAMYVKYGLAPSVRRKLGKEPQTVYETDTSVNLFFKEPLHMLKLGESTYMTFRHFRKKLVVPEPGPQDGPRPDGEKRDEEKRDGTRSGWHFGKLHL